MGPITLFDKSFLQSLSTDESVWFDHFFYPVIAPLFFIETLADLEKPPRDGKTAEEEVGIIAAKTPEMSGAPCHFHHVLAVQDLIGNAVPLTGQIPVAGIRRVVHQGKEGGVAEVPPEAKAFARWQRGQFLEVDRLYARAWRAQIARIDLSTIEHAMKHSGVSPTTCKSLESALKFADQTILGLTKSPGRFDSMLDMLEVHPELKRGIKDRWKAQKHPRLAAFAPYAAHVLRVELFFHAGIAAKLIASSRPSHRIDIAYLFYLPFCTLFVSSDRLHRACAPHFTRPNQEFVWGPDLKADLSALNAHFASLSEEVKAQGIYKFASRLPDESNGLVRRLLERHVPNLLKPEREVKISDMGKEAHEKIVQHVKAWESAPEARNGEPAGDFESLVIKRHVSRRRGSWLQVGPEIE